MPFKKYKYDQIEFLINEVIDLSKASVVLPDCFIEKIFFQNYTQKVTTQVIKKSATELSIEWIENNLMSYDMFSGNEIYIIYEVEKLKKKMVDSLSEIDFSRSEKGIIFVSTSSKASSKYKFFKSLDGFEISAPKFWESRLYIDAYSRFFNVEFKSDVKGFIGQVVEQNAEGIFEAISLLSAFAKNGQLDLVSAKKILKQGHLDNFALADMLNQKNLKNLFRSLLMVESDYQVFRSFFLFIQGHILKIIDPSYLEQKPKLSKYDQGIKAASRQWKSEELVELLELFSDLEIRAKSKDLYLRDQIRLQYLRN